PVGSPPDAPAYLRLRFGEIPYEIAADLSDYRGEVSRSWIQEEVIHVDVLPNLVRLPRRYAFRYLEIAVLDTSPKYRVVVDDVVCTHVTSADRAEVPPLDIADPELARLDQVSLKTMEDCMQLVFEDGPKRDRRLWIADLRLQALTNYVTFQNNDLVKRCLYLFAGMTQNEGRVGACLFLEPAPQVDDTALFDYSLFFVSCLHDYFEATGDRETLAELFPTAHRQIELALAELDGRDVVKDKDTWWCFLDWGGGLNKQAGAQAILIYALRQARQLALWLDDGDRAEEYQRELERVARGALERLWDESLGFFVSGEQRQVSWASQVWFALAGVFDREKNAVLLRHLIEANPGVPMVTPYMYHYFIQALLDCGLSGLAEKYLKEYWGGMVRDGADTFWELYDPKDRYASPYGSRAVNSFCHAWSSTPAYFIRKYLSR
ncbi:MAG: sugar hydrolase, partial [Oscillospiraceae bacterium]|nr:sugar hydrolase [Oscillospiraceae bacterium]